MANEAVVRTSLQIKDGTLFYQSQPTAFVADVSTGLGPTPGLVTVPVTGVSVSLAALTTPGFAFIQNLDATNFIMVGVYDGTSFFPLLELLPGECYVVRLCRHLGDEFVGTGTPADANALRLMADPLGGASCYARVEVFEK